MQPLSDPSNLYRQFQLIIERIITYKHPPPLESIASFKPSPDMDASHTYRLLGWAITVAYGSCAGRAWTALSEWMASTIGTARMSSLMEAALPWYGASPDEVAASECSSTLPLFTTHVKLHARHLLNGVFEGLLALLLTPFAVSSDAYEHVQKALVGTFVLLEEVFDAVLGFRE